MDWLYRYETKGIQNWILSSNLLRDLSGGSALVEALTTEAERLAKEAGASDILQATSGSMTAVFPSKESLAKFASEWPMQVAFLTPGLQMIQAWVEKTQGTKALFAKLIEKRNRMDVLDLEVNPWVLRAGRSGLPAVPKPRDLGTNSRQTAVDALVLAKERSFQADHYKCSDVAGGRDWTDFEERVDEWPGGPIAIIHADGSGVGQRLMNIGDDYDKLKRFSQALKDCSKEATAAAVQGLGPVGKHLYARPVVSAGDDLTYIVPASKARAFAQAWLHAFEQATESRKADLLGDRLYGGAGIVVVQKGYPFANAYEHCEALCKAAKDRLKKLGRSESVIAFKRITTSLVDEKELTAGTFAWVLDKDGGLKQLESLVSAVRDLPRGTLRTWLDHFLRDEGRTRARQLWSRAREVALSKAASNWKDLEEALKATGADPESGAYSSSREPEMALPLGDAKNSTPIGDALALKQMEAPEDR